MSLTQEQMAALLGGKGWGDFDLEAVQKQNAVDQRAAAQKNYEDALIVAARVIVERAR